MLLPRRHTESLATAPLPDEDTAWPWTTAPRSGYKSELYGGRGNTLAPACSMARATPEARWGFRLSNTTTSPACNSGTSTMSTYVWNAAVSVAPGKASGASTPPNPNAAITLTVPHVVGTEP